MKKIIFLTVFGLTLSCDSPKQAIEGELYFKLITLLPNKGLTNEESIKVERYLKENQASHNPQEQELHQFYARLKKNNLLRSPNIRLKTIDNKVNEVFLTSEQYKKLEGYSLDALNKRGKKVKLRLEAIAIDSALFSCEKIISIEEVDGQTPWSK